jgi:predicted Zn-dependent protease
MRGHSPGSIARRNRPGRLRAWILSAALAVCVVGACGCTTEVPITGRRSLALVSASQMDRLAANQYGEFLKTHQLSRNARATAMVKRVGGRIRKAVERYFRGRGEAHRLNGYAWDFRLVADEQKNAFCMPGGRVVVYEGILPVTRDEAGLAAVIGHEVAHAVAQHSRERMSHQLLVGLGGMALDRALDEKGAKTKNIFMGLYGVGTGLGMLKHSRTQESEADHLGLVFMAMAGYDPHAALGVWKRMAASRRGGQPPAFLSTHPTDAHRIESIRQLIPEAMPYYRGGGANASASGTIAPGRMRGGPATAGATAAPGRMRGGASSSSPKKKPVDRENERLRGILGDR